LFETLYSRDTFKTKNNRHQTKMNAEVSTNKKKFFFKVLKSILVACTLLNFLIF
jgi:hypothetical protein